MKLKKEKSLLNVSSDIEFLERLAGVNEELEDLVKISKGEKKIDRSIISKRDIIGMFTEKEPQKKMPKFMLTIFRILVVKNLMRGRFFSVAYSSGKEIGLSASPRDRKDFIKLSERLGLKKIEIVHFNPAAIKIRLYNGITPQGIKKSNRPICFFEAGLYSGFLQNVFQKKLDLKETKCMAMGDSYCEFTLAEKESKDHRSVPLYPADVYSKENLKLLTSLAAHSIVAIENALSFEKTKRQVVIDALTGVHNHRYFQTRLRTEYTSAHRYSFPIALIMLDVDDFKKINDKYGHPTGDEVLKSVSACLVDNVREVDIVSRYGGDEFTVILPHTDSDGAMIAARRIKNAVSKKKMHLKGKKAYLTISIGAIALGARHLTMKAAALVEAADKALLRAKKKGKNNIIFINKG